jgi:hypothetical protein
MRIVIGLVTLVIAVLISSTPSHACCPAPPPGKPVVNADQAVILLWDGEKKTEHFIRRATFKSAADDFGFLIPTPSEPDLAESGDAAFPYLVKVTEPEVIQQKRPGEGGCGCAGMPGAKSAARGGAEYAPPPQVAVLQEKTVAGFHAVVLEAKSANALVGWLKEHNYEMSPAVEAWAKPYVDQGWKITALKVAKEQDQAQQPRVSAASLRMSFKTDRPLFPYREPQTEQLGKETRLLRIYFIGESRYDGALGDQPWGHRFVAWSNKLTPEQRKQTLDHLKLPPETGPATFWLSEFEDPWLTNPPAKNDLYFAASKEQSIVKRPPIIEYVSANDGGDRTAAAFGFFVAPWIALRLARRLGRDQKRRDERRLP